MNNNGVGSWPRRRQPKSGAKPALVVGDRSLSYDGLAERIDKAANALRRRGVMRGDRVAYLGENGHAFVEVFFACGVLGAIFVPLNTRLTAPELRYLLQDSGARLLVNEDVFDAIAEAAVDDTGVTHRLLVTDAESSEEGSLPVVSYERAVSTASAEVIDETVGLDDGAVILYTSGTTGRPKGALLTHGNLTWNCYNVLADMDVSSNDVALMISPLFHAASLGMGLLPALLKGGTVILERKFDPGRCLALIARHRVTTLSGVPTTFQMLAEHPDWAATDLGSLSKLTCGGSAVPGRVLESYEARGIGFTSCYGMTEAAPGVSMLPQGRSQEKAGSAGLSHFFTDIRIAGPAGDTLLPGEAGEIQTKGPNVIRGYWNRPEATHDAFADGWFRSGDIGYRDEEAFLYISDRLKDMIISGGENIYPAEVEAIIVELPQVASVAVIGVPDDKWGEVPKAIVTLAQGAKLTKEDLRAHLDGRLARYKIPKTVVFVEEMPRTATGKIRKADLRNQYCL